jgi:shikimate dehydrogenase
MRLFGIIGYPLSHSFSKKYFTEKFEREGLIDCRYELFPIASIEKLPQVLRSNPSLEGLNVTIPYKKSVLKYIDISKLPADLTACNCIKIQNGTLVGYNTDYIGFGKSIQSLLKPHHKKALVLGNGGATEAVVFVLKQLHLEFKIVSRLLHDTSSLVYSEISEKVIEAHPVIINTTPLGMYPNVESCPDIPYQYITNRHLLFDLIYNPVKTLFLQKGEQQGATIQNGEEMLLLQAAENWKIWNT